MNYCESCNYKLEKLDGKNYRSLMLCFNKKCYRGCKNICDYLKQCHTPVIGKEKDLVLIPFIICLIIALMGINEILIWFSLPCVIIWGFLQIEFTTCKDCNSDLL